MSENEINSVLYRYGASIFDSAEFKQAMNQKHHNRTTVGDHTIRVAHTSLKICNFLEKIHISTKKSDVVVGALCHDLGILDRDKCFKNNAECYREHPTRSLDVARRLVPDINYNTEKIIRCHMWPVTITKFPTSKESMIVSIADKYAAVGDGIMRKKTAAAVHARSKRAMNYGA